MPLVGRGAEARSSAHVKWAERYAREGKVHRAISHFGCALEYSGFGSEEELRKLLKDGESVRAAAAAKSSYTLKHSGLTFSVTLCMRSRRKRTWTRGGVFCGGSCACCTGLGSRPSKRTRMRWS